MPTVAGQAMDQDARIKKFKEIADQPGIIVSVQNLHLTPPVHLSKPRTLHDMQQVQFDAIHAETVQLSGHGQHFHTRLARQA